MKKLYDQVWRGYYVLSVVVGFLLAVSIAMVLEVGALGAMTNASGATLDFLDNLWEYLPLNLCNILWDDKTENLSLNLMMVTASVASVAMFVRMSGGKNSRTKILQTLATTLLALCLMLAYAYATRGWIVNPAVAVVPVLLMVVPLTILRKTQLPLDDQDPKPLQAAWMRVYRTCEEHTWLLFVVAGVCMAVAIWAILLITRMYA